MQMETHLKLARFRLINLLVLMTSQARQLFGTDGIRGVAGEFPLTLESTYLIGRALGHDLMRTAPRPRAVIGQDTRESSAWIADRVAGGSGLRRLSKSTAPASSPLRAWPTLPVHAVWPQAWSSPPRTIPGPITASKFFPAMVSNSPMRTNWPSKKKFSRCYRTLSRR